MTHDRICQHCGKEFVSQKKSTKYCSHRCANLADKAVREPVKVERVEVVRDTLVYRDRVQTVTVGVEKKLTWWHRFRLTLGNI